MPEKNSLIFSRRVPDVIASNKEVKKSITLSKKLFEELLMSDEGMRKTPNKLIYIGSPIEFNEENFIEELEALRAAENKSFDEIRAKLREIVPTYTG